MRPALSAPGLAQEPPLAELIDDALATAGLGTWIVDLRTEEVFWSSTTHAIHEVEPGFVPTLATGLAFYAPKGQEVICSAVAAGRAEGRAWDLDLPFITARGREICVRSSGRVILANGIPTHLVGTIADVTRQRAEAADNDRLSLVVRQMSNAAIITDAQGHTEWVNEGFTRLTGYRLEEIRGKKPGHVLQGPETDGVERAAMRDAIRQGRPILSEIRNYRRDGVAYWISVDITPIRNADGSLRGFIAIEADITARKNAEAETAAEIQRRTEAETLLRELMDASASAVIAYDQHEHVIFFNDAYGELFPLMVEGMKVGAKLEEVIAYGLTKGQYPEAGKTPEAQAAWMAQYLAAHRNPGQSRELILPDGRWLQLRERRSPSGYLVCTRADITRLKQAEELARRRSEEDHLTGLGNRARLFDKLAGLVPARRQEDPHAACLLIFDLDHFKATNDTLGHPAGDALLREIAIRGRELMRKDDCFVRLGGDEFAILLPGVINAAQATSFIGQLRTRMEQPLAYGNATITPSLSIGAALFPADAPDTDALFRSADTALYQAKRLGRHCHSFFDRTIAAALERKSQLAEELRRAIAREDVQVALQPQVRTRDRAHLGFEALARWSEGQLPVPPSEFIPVAEEMGLIAPLGRLILTQALDALSRLIRSGLEPGRVAVNIATAQLLTDDFPRQVRNALDAAGLDASRLEIEMTETTMLDRSAERIVHVLRELKTMGVFIALDDFGTGYASLSHLTQFPVDRLKIDSRFVRDLGMGGTPSPIARTVIGLAHGLGLEAVAEGVETEAQFRYLADLGCDVIQGYLIGKPLSYEGAEAYLRSHAPGLAARRALAQVGV